MENIQGVELSEELAEGPRAMTDRSFHFQPQFRKSSVILADLEQRVVPKPTFTSRRR